MNTLIFISLTILSLLMVGLYTIAVCVKGKKIPNSISASFYAIEHKRWFRATMWTTPMLLMPSILEYSNPNIQFLAFLTLVGMIMVGCAPDYINDPIQRKVHTAGAIMCIVCSQIWSCIICKDPVIIAWFIYFMGTIIYMAESPSESSFKRGFMKTKPMFWIEICAITVIYVEMFILLF